MLNRQEVISAISNTLRNLPEVSTYIFGSSARGDYREDSDIDLLILLPDHLSSRERVELEAEICGLLWPIEMETDITIAPIMLPHKVWNQRSTPFTVNVTNDRIKI